MSIRTALYALLMSFCVSGIALQASAEDMQESLMVMEKGQLPSFNTESDRQLRDAVIARLKADSELRGVIDVRAYSGKVVIEGTMETVAMIYRTVERTRELPGVKAVNVNSLGT